MIYSEEMLLNFEIRSMILHENTQSKSSLSAVIHLTKLLCKHIYIYIYGNINRIQHQLILYCL